MVLVPSNSCACFNFPLYLQNEIAYNLKDLFGFRPMVREEDNRKILLNGYRVLKTGGGAHKMGRMITMSYVFCQNWWKKNLPLKQMLGEIFSVIVPYGLYLITNAWRDIFCHRSLRVVLDHKCFLTSDQLSAHSFPYTKMFLRQPLNFSVKTSVCCRELVHSLFPSRSLPSYSCTACRAETPWS